MADQQSSTNAPTLEALLAAGVHFGHQTRRWNPEDAPVHFRRAQRDPHHRSAEDPSADRARAEARARRRAARRERALRLHEAAARAASCSAEAERASALFITERWLGGLLTNFQTVKKQVRRMKELEAGSEEGGEFENYTKKEQLMLRREREKLSKYLNGIRNMARLPGLMFVVDSKKERIARQRGEQARHPDHRHRRHERRSGSHHGADRRQRRRDSLGRADHEGDRRRGHRGAPRSAGPRGSRGRRGSYTYSSDRGAEPAGEEERKRRRRPRRRRAKPEAIAARLKGAGRRRAGGCCGRGAPRRVGRTRHGRRRKRLPDRTRH